MNEKTRIILGLLIWYHHQAMLALIDELHREITFQTYGPEWPYSKN